MNLKPQRGRGQKMGDIFIGYRRSYLESRGIKHALDGKRFADEATENQRDERRHG